MKLLLLATSLLLLSGCTCTNLFEVVTFQSCVNEQPDNSQYDQIINTPVQTED